MKKGIKIIRAMLPDKPIKIKLDIDVFVHPKIDRENSAIYD